MADDVLAPGWTSYQYRLRYQAYDVTEKLVEGANVLGAIVGDGWFRGRLGFREQRNLYGDHLAFLAQLEIEFEDGTTEIVTTDTNWRATTGPILASSLYDGEHHDARLELAGWAEPSYDDRKWSGVRVAPRPASALVAPTGPPVRRIELLEPVDILESPSGRPIIDFGQNLVGRLRISVDGDRGQHDHDQARRGTRTRRALRAPSPRARPPPTATHSPVVEKRSGSRGSPSTVFVTPRSTAGQAN